MNDQFMTTMSRRARLAAEAQLRDWRRRARDGLERVLGAIEALNAASADETITAFRDRIERFGHGRGGRGVPGLRPPGGARLSRRHAGPLRHAAPVPAGFVALPLQAAVGSEPLMAAIRVLRALDQGARGAVEPTDPCGFVPAAWRPFLIENGRVDRRIWEIALALALRDALRAGNLFLAESREHVSFWDLIHNDRRWREPGQAYAGLDLPLDPTTFLDRITTALDAAARTAARGLPHNASRPSSTADSS